jgi:hypothetical protein
VILGKCEQLNPGYSKKDRIAKQIIEDAEAVRPTALSPLPLISSYKPEKSLWSRTARCAPASQW